MFPQPRRTELKSESNFYCSPQHNVENGCDLPCKLFHPQTGRWDVLMLARICPAFLSASPLLSLNLRISVPLIVLSWRLLPVRSSLLCFLRLR